MKNDILYIHVCDVDGLVSEIESIGEDINYYHSECYDNNSIKSVVRPSKAQWLSFLEKCKEINTDSWSQNYCAHPFGHAAYLKVVIQNQNLCIKYAGNYICSTFDGGDELGTRFGEDLDFEDTTEIGRFIDAVRDLLGGLPFG